MNLHTSQDKPDWEYQSSEHPTRWQAIAIATNGVITPANVISVFGLLLVIYGSILLYNGSEITGLLVILAGRIMDLLDGIVAEATKTKSRLGEIVDTVCDKLTIVVTAIAAYTADLLPIELLIILFLHHTYTSLYSILFAQRYRIHTTRLGKYAMFTSWVAIIVSIYSNIVDIQFVDVLATVTIFGYAALAAVACYDYYRLLQQKIVERLRAAQWTRDISTIIYVYNPKASNYKRAQRWIDKLSKKMTHQRIDIDIKEAEDLLVDTIRQYTKDEKKVLLAVAGGDGTVSSVANLILATKDQEMLQKCYLLPLWGGNANDLAYMLNGLSSNNTSYHLFTQSTPAEVPTIHISLTHNKITRDIYACCYASFGASAYAARQLDKKRIATHRFIHYFPPLIMVREFTAVAKALGASPRFKAQFEDIDQELYEHTFINGSRIAKVNRVPISLSEKAFFHAAIDRKHPSFLIEIIRIIAKRSKKQYVKRQTITFTLQDDVDAQIDGEVYPLLAGTKININVNSLSLLCISTKL